MGCMIIFSLQAIADLESAVRFIAKDNPDAAVRVGNSLMDRVAILARSSAPISCRVRKLVSRLTSSLPPGLKTA